MQKKYFKSILGSFFYVPMLFAGTMGANHNITSLRPIVSILGGYAGINSQVSSTFYDSDNFFKYRTSSHAGDAGVGGVFLGVEYIRTPNLLIQLGADYTYFSSIKARGFNTVGVEPGTSTFYRIHYQFQGQQLLAATKILTTVRETLHPYVFAGIGASFNDMYHYRATTSETCCINLTPMFKNDSHSKFSYAAGIGIDYDLNQHARLGLGYRFSDFGHASLGHGATSVNHIKIPFPFKLGTHHNYANQAIVQLSYLF